MAKAFLRQKCITCSHTILRAQVRLSPMIPLSGPELPDHSCLERVPTEPKPRQTERESPSEASESPADATRQRRRLDLEDLPVER